MNCGVCWFLNTTASLAFTELLSASVSSVQIPTIGIDSRYLIPQSILFTFFDTLHYITFCHVAFHQQQVECCITSCDMMTDSLSLTHTHTHTHTHTYIYVYLCVYTFVYIHTWVRCFMFVSIYNI